MTSTGLRVRSAVSGAYMRMVRGEGRAQVPCKWRPAREISVSSDALCQHGAGITHLAPGAAHVLKVLPVVHEVTKRR